MYIPEKQLHQQKVHRFFFHLDTVQNQIDAALQHESYVDLESILPFQKEDIESLINGQLVLKTKFIQSDSILFSKHFVQDCTKAFKDDLIHVI
jgi:hypothetical protein